MFKNFTKQLCGDLLKKSPALITLILTEVEPENQNHGTKSQNIANCHDLLAGPIGREECCSVISPSDDSPLSLFNVHNMHIWLFYIATVIYVGLGLQSQTNVFILETQY